ADADLLRALLDRIGDESVDAERREQQREQREAPEQQHGETARRHGSIDELLHGPEVVVREVRRDRLQRAAQRARQRARRHRRADDEIVRRLILALTHRDVHLLAGRALERQMAHVADDADHAPLARAGADDDLADRILPGPDVARHRLVDHDHRIARRTVGRRDVPAGDDRNAHRGGIAVADDAYERRRTASPLERHALGAHAPGAVLAERKRIGDARGLYARYLLHPAQDVVEVRIALFGRRVAAVGIDANRRGVRRLESHVDLEHAEQAANEEPGAHEQHARKRDLGYDQGAAYGRAPASLRRA